MSLKDTETCIKDEQYWQQDTVNCKPVQLATRTSSPMAQVLIIGILALLLLQLAAGQTTACVDAFTTLANNTASCTTPESICSGQCRQYYDAIIDNCDQAVS